jgi:diadenosine tetraphosphate (Ap4A) HIT family hydrolase
MGASACCRFCNLIDGIYQYPAIDEPFAYTKDFVAVASIGALVEGWTLIIPRNHQFSMKNIFKKSNFLDFVNSLLPRLVNTYGPLIAFEHGANKEGSSTACGTNHAHLHLVPYKKSLLPAMFDSGLAWEACNTAEIERKTGNEEYLFYSELNVNTSWQNPTGFLHVLAQSKSQFFRRLIAEQNGNSATSDYKLFPYFDIAKKTRLTLSENIA